MLNKEISGGVLPSGESSVKFLDSYSKGLHVEGMMKYASSQLQHMAKDIKPEEGYAHVHLISTGCGEAYGANNNSDYYTESPRDVVAIDPSMNGRTMSLDGGLINQHKTFSQFGDLYTEHANGLTKNTPQGSVVAEAYNTDMRRGELIVKIDLGAKGWADRVQKIESGGNIFFSIGAGVPYDVCSYCLRKASVPEQFCSHRFQDRLQMTAEGGQVYLYNNLPTFHDISGVKDPADAIAFGLSKVASNTPHNPYVQSGGIFMPLDVVRSLAEGKEKKRLNMFEKVAMLIKEVPAMLAEHPIMGDVAKAVTTPWPEEDCAKLDKFPLPAVMQELNNKQIMLPPQTFMRIVKREPLDVSGTPDISEAVASMFTPTRENVSEIISDGSYEPSSGGFHPGLTDAVNSLARHSLHDGAINRKIMVSEFSPEIQQTSPTIIKIASTVSEGDARLAKEYTKYQLSFLTQNKDCAGMVSIINAIK